VVNHAALDGVKTQMRNTKTELIDKPSARYGGLASPAMRKSILEKRLQKAKCTPEQILAYLKGENLDIETAEPTLEDENAGQNIVLHKDSRWKEAWSSFKEGNPVVQGIFNFQNRLEESDNFVAGWYRMVKKNLGLVFEENEMGAAFKRIRQLDPNFSMDEFLNDARLFMIPEVLEAFLEQDDKKLRLWCGDAAYEVLQAGIAARAAMPDLSIVAKILELRNVEVHTARLMDDDTPLIVLTFHTDQIEYVRNKEGKVIEGDEVSDSRAIAEMMNS